MAIYDGLVGVERRCIQVAATRNPAPGIASKLSDHQWQALVALHRTLLRECLDLCLISPIPQASRVPGRPAGKHATGILNAESGLFGALFARQQQRQVGAAEEVEGEDGEGQGEGEGERGWAGDDGGLNHVRGDEENQVGWGLSRNIGSTAASPAARDGDGDRRTKDEDPRGHIRETAEPEGTMLSE
ncbi:uncharacterized protein THITE_2090668 [Thermothielavioides terrestris NRRL 8126]|uniref:Uncharacterized protein n=1 Tax=Thermothielavioides terrestris (strain ATCC 38088 / NRRL 8126) TaxID=578455 RepID=G2RBJ1_THETT|nr:uncharacterized protein THITE_2090668 [Thermothielavioides terrestris NRRL 8126]AEO69162.1 hypothetical protein THITE_2090668 [Thermothielavioides terrestris NRRL 8126]